MIFKSGLWGGHFITWASPDCSFGSKQLFYLYSAVCLGLLSRWNMKSLPMRHLPERIAWWIRICLCFTAFIIPSILTKLTTPFTVKHPQTIIKPLPCLTVGLKYISCICSQPLLFTYCLLFEVKISNLIHRLIIYSYIVPRSISCVLWQIQVVFFLFLVLDKASFLPLDYEGLLTQVLFWWLQSELGCKIFEQDLSPIPGLI